MFKSVQEVWRLSLIVFIIDGGDVFAWGLNQHGQCGVGALMDELKSGVDAECFKVSASSWIVNVFQPLSIKRLPAISEVCCGWSHVLAVTSKLYCLLKLQFGFSNTTCKTMHLNNGFAQFTDKCTHGEGQIMDSWALEIEMRISIATSKQIAAKSQEKFLNCRVQHR